MERLSFSTNPAKSRKRKVPTTFMKSLAKSGSEILASARDAYVERLDSSDLAPAQKALLLRLAGLKDSDNAKTQTDIEVAEEDGVLNSSVAKRMLKWLAEAVGRGLDLSGGNETAKDIYAFLNLLLTNMGELYIETALDAWVTRLFHFLQIANMIVELLISASLKKPLRMSQIYPTFRIYVRPSQSCI